MIPAKADSIPSEAQTVRRVCVVEDDDPSVGTYHGANQVGDGTARKGGKQITSKLKNR